MVAEDGQFGYRESSFAPAPRYSVPGSQLAVDAGTVYMLLEGFYGITLPDVEFDMCNLPVGFLFDRSNSAPTLNFFTN
jgi:hypothetical protein